MNNTLLASGFNINQLTTEINNATGARSLNSITDIFSDNGTNLGIITLVFFVAGAMTVTYLIYGGIMLMTSAADPKKVAGAQETIKNAFLGLIIVIFAYWIVQLVGLVLGLDGFAAVF